MERLTWMALAVASFLAWTILIPNPATAQNESPRATVSDRVMADRLASENGSYRVVEVVRGLEHPWAVAFLPDGRMLVTERPGRLRLVAGGDVIDVQGLPEIHADEDQLTAPQGGSQSGLLDVVVHPNYSENGWIYFAYSSPGDDDGVIDQDEEYGTATAVARARLSADGSRLEDLETIYAQSPRQVPGRHYGSRIVFPGDGTVLFSIGDRGLRWPSQDLTDPGGSVIRLMEDGGIHPDNPFIGVEPGNLRGEIYAYGLRNPQGMIVHPETGEIWAHEHGPYGGDLLHVIERGTNYGWPIITRGVEYSTGEKIGVGRSAPGLEQPLYWWDEAIAPSGLAFYDGEYFPEWRGNLFLGSLLQKQLHRLVIDGRNVTHEEVLLDDMVGRIRDVRQGPDGFLYVVTDESDGGVYRLEPAD
jgi:aldose sugar dehydrogenase